MRRIRGCLLCALIFVLLLGVSFGGYILFRYSKYDKYISDMAKIYELNNQLLNAYTSAIDMDEVEIVIDRALEYRSHQNYEYKVTGEFEYTIYSSKEIDVEMLKRETDTVFRNLNFKEIFVTNDSVEFIWIENILGSYGGIIYTKDKDRFTYYRLKETNDANWFAFRYLYA